jgi:undecaprenyl diphosphate synthase
MTKNLPKHIAIIMDGNGRWAKARRLPRTAGHKKGVETTKAIVRHAGDQGLEYLTLFAFSTENWSRSQDEVGDLMQMLRHFMKADAAELLKNNVKLRAIGARDRLDDDIVKMIESLEKQSMNNDGLNLTIALDYGGRQEILNAVNSLLASSCGLTTRSHDTNTKDPAIKSQDDSVSESDFEKHLYTSDLPDPDLLIRTSGEKRISNFLLWQCAYSEFVFSDKFWPDFTVDDFNAAITEYNARDRRFGGTEETAAIS